jgi:hypothetical protein
MDAARTQTAPCFSRTATVMLCVLCNPLKDCVVNHRCVAGGGIIKRGEIMNASMILVRVAGKLITLAEYSMQAAAYMADIKPELYRYDLAAKKQSEQIHAELNAHLAKRKRL